MYYSVILYAMKNMWALIGYENVSYSSAEN